MLEFSPRNHFFGQKHQEMLSREPYIFRKGCTLLSEIFVYNTAIFLDLSYRNVMENEGQP